MERLLIGSSNVAGFYDPSKFKEYPPYKMIKCTKVELFRVAVETIKDEKEVIISVIENFLCDAIRPLKDPTSDQIDSMVEGVLDDYVGVIKKAAIRLPNTRFALAQPILRPAHNWYMERFEGFCKLFINKVNSTGLENVSKLDTLSRMSQSFTADGIHLTADSGRTFVNMLLFNAENFFETEVINLDEDPDRREPDRQHTVFAKGLKNLEKTLKEIKKEEQKFLKFFKSFIIHLFILLLLWLFFKACCNLFLHQLQLQLAIVQERLQQVYLVYIVRYTSLFLQEYLHLHLQMMELVRPCGSRPPCSFGAGTFGCSGSSEAKAKTHKLAV